MSQTKKLILVIGATGAQGIAVIDALLAPVSDGSPSPYAIRALTRDPSSRRAKLLAEKGVECFQGTVEDFNAVSTALEGCYGAWVNIDSFTVGEAKETWCGIRIFELAKRSKTLRHYVFSHLDYVLKETNYNPKYEVDHYNAKGRIGDFMKQQPSETTDNGMTWSLVSTGPYMEMLNSPLLGLNNKRKDGTVVFATIVGKGHVPLIALADLGYFARYAFDHRAETSAQDLKIASDMVGWDYLAATFTKVTGQKAIVRQLTEDEYFACFINIDRPLASERTYGDGSKTFKQNATTFWSLYRDDVIKRDMDWLRKVNPNTSNLEKWMRETKYTGEFKPGLLKLAEDGHGGGINVERIALL
ncbi:hypothetical protein NM688_g2758 [Phlebia brevispora]|uniref:Uncharacterized protein n=1 Tax=Phlebia brevispora TaxID=194682 RepID=A0ACC1T7T6_9APHY|nr:hypothetical protein NM688_g2758 [Phlebia brevispora]